MKDESPGVDKNQYSGESHGWRSLVGCSPWGLKESGMTERLHFHFSLSCIGEGNGNSLQCSCLDNPRDGGAWWAAVYGILLSRQEQWSGLPFPSPGDLPDPGIEPRSPASRADALTSEPPIGDT